MTRNRFLPGLNTMPQHDTPGMVGIDVAHSDIALTIARHQVQVTADALGVIEAFPAEITINGRKCTLTGDVLDGWYLVETTTGHEPQDKRFYLLPHSSKDFDAALGNVPSVRCEDPEFDEKYEGARQVREMHWYILGILAKLIKN